MRFRSVAPRSTHICQRSPFGHIIPLSNIAYSGTLSDIFGLSLMKKKLLAFVVTIAYFLLVPNSLLLVISLRYLSIGSLETFPTDEQQEKARLVAGLLVLIFLIIEIALIIIIRKTAKKIT